ncbi:glycosyltransferase [Nocardioides gilvus]|uniref:glycosyltransferase n=1 Tax=Nocardioides gilvus TaxID=1735589 RepID=UPI000D7449CE|nr:glycosyltransferase [Nocardioides gilvus]
MTVLINAANLKVGGGVQVGASFLDELAAMRNDPELVGRFPWLQDSLAIVASSQVLDNLSPGTRERLPVVARPATVDFAALLRARYDVSFTVFGPEYVPINARRRIVGFADVTSLHPEYLPPARGKAKARQFVRRVLSRATFSTTRSLVVEAERVKRSLGSRWGISPSRVTVVPNAYNAIFDRPEEWRPLEVPKDPDVANVCYVTGLYPHKNHAILGQVHAALELRGMSARFLLTLSDREWMSLPQDVRRASLNMGQLTLDQLPSLYAASDASIFPSLFEAFSVTPLEAMVTGTPLVASDRDFVRDVCGDHPRYAEPNDAGALAVALADALVEGRGRRTQHGIEAARHLPNAADRGLSYVELIDQNLRGSRRSTLSQWRERNPSRVARRS